MYDHFLALRRTQIIFACLLLPGALLFHACQVDSGKQKNITTFRDSAEIALSSVNHADGFDLVTEDNFHLLHIFSHYNDTADTTSYVLAGENVAIPHDFTGYTSIKIPVDKIALLHSSYISYFDFCGTTDRIKAISEAKYIYNEEIYESVQKGNLREVGFGDGLDKEQLLALGIDLVVTVGWPNVPNKDQQRLEELGVPLLIFSDWQEGTLLGRMEWVKVVAALTGNLGMVNVKYDKIAGVYDSLRQLTHDLDDRPSIVCNLPYRGSWYVPGGNSYVSNLLQDAGGHYLWNDDKGTGGLQLDFETVFARGLQADYWINPGFSFTIEDILDKDERLKDFSAIHSGKVYNSVNKISRNQANDYWESGITNPHLILADLIHILHPELLPEHQLVYYKQLF